MLLLLGLFGRLPLPLLRWIATGIGFCMYYGSTRLRTTVQNNLAQAKLSLTTRDVILVSARAVADMLWVWFNTTEKLASRCTTQNPAQLEGILGQAKPLILLSPHIGCFEAVGKWCAINHPLTSMYRKPDKPWICALVEGARAGSTQTMATADSAGVRLVLRALKNNTTVGILPDQVPKAGEGVWIPWFGRLAYTITLPAKLHLATGAPIYAIMAIPNKRGWELFYEKIDIPSTEKDPTVITTIINNHLESFILTHPIHYAWSYKRYKGQPPNL